MLDAKNSSLSLPAAPVGRRPRTRSLTALVVALACFAGCDAPEHDDSDALEFRSATEALESDDDQDLPGLDEALESSAANQTSYQAFFDSLDPEARGQVEATIADLHRSFGSPAEGGEFAPDLQAQIERTDEAFINAAGGAEANIDSVTQSFAQAAVAGVDEDLLRIAATVQRNLDRAQGLREDIADIRDVLSDPDAFGPPDGVEVFDTPEGPQELTKEQATALMERLEGELDTVRSMNEMDQLRLQDTLHQKQQAEQLLSNIMKMFHDTAKSIIGNLRG